MKAWPHRGLTSLLGTIAVFALMDSATAMPLFVESISQGWYRNDGVSNGLPNFVANTLTGTFKAAGTPDLFEYRSYFTFDTSSLESPIRSGKIRIYQEYYFSSVLSEKITFYEVATPGNILMNRPSRQMGTGIFADLGSGPVYGEASILGEPGWTFIGNWLDVELTAPAIAAINAARQSSNPFSMGVALNSLDGTAFTQEYLINGQLMGGTAEAVRFSDNNAENRAFLLVEAEKPKPEPNAVPEPATWGGTLAALGLGMKLRYLPRKRSISGR